MKLHQTKWSELQYGKVEGYQVCYSISGKPRKVSDWRFFNEDHVVGGIYPTKEALLADMERYARESWGLT